MTFKTYEINVDLINDISTTSAIRFSQNDRNSAKLLLTITNEGAELDLSKAKSVRMSFKKPDGTRVFQNDCQPINALEGKYQILLKTQTLTAIGNVIAQIHIEEEDRILDTQKFLFVVNESLAGDGAVESTNEYTIIAKAIEAGEKLEGVDINGIIAAGELAKGALPKTGGTINGDLVMATDKNIVFSSDDYLLKIRGQKGNSKIVAQVIKPDGTSIFIGEYRGDNNKLTINCDTNLLKNTGDTMTGKLVMDKAQPIDFNDKDGKRKSNIGIDSNGRFYSWDEAGGKYFWVKNADGTFTVNADNLVKKTGDTITGTQKMGTNAIIQQEQHKRNANAKGIFYTDEGSATTVAGVGRYVNDTGEDFMYMGHGSSPWNSTSGLRVSPTFLTYKGKNVMTAEKDDRATIPVTADAELITSYGVIADRRGNTVTLRAPIRRKVGSTNGHVFTIPAGMRPTMLLSQVVFSNDGTPALFTIPSDTGVVQLQTISPVITGKDYYILLSYVVD
ncbi:MULTISPECIES: BppU family phage baseplate upper protein [Bacillus cereus group]|uniref:BppU family phage baseplate upper protein n=1 Tax=Bacillus cereus group TaxID=86661 RepID=UPI0006281EF5|nr:BppU family phage baseplate upper protein [Bacillus pacificus]KMQ28529.1 hypothetical protein TU53_23405 [Bacillus cereus]